MNEDQEVSNSLKAVVKSSAFVSFGSLASKVLAFVFRLVLSRLGPAAYGLLSIGMSFVETAAMAGSLGMNEGVMRYASEYSAKGDKKRLGQAIAWSLLIATVGSFTFFLLGYFFRSDIAQFFGEPDLALIAWIMFSAIPAVALSGILNSAFTSTQNVRWQVFVKNVLENFFKVVCVGVAVFFFSMGTIGAAIAYAVAMLFTVLSSWYILQKQVVSFPLRIPAFDESLKAMTRYSLTLYGHIMVITLAAQLPLWVLGVYAGVAAVGVFNSALPTANVLLLPTSIIAFLFVPLAVQAHDRGNLRALARFYKTIVRWVLAASLPVALFFIIFPDRIMQALWGYQYVEGALALRILAAGYLANAVYVVEYGMLVTLKRPGKILANSVVVGILTVALSFVLIPQYGVMGAALATALALAAQAVLFFIETWRVSRMHPLSWPLVKQALASLAAAIAFMALVAMLALPADDRVVNVALFGAFLAASYALLYAFKFFNDEDWKLWLAVKAKLYSMLSKGPQKTEGK